MVTIVASSASSLFRGMATDGTYIYIGQHDGKILKVDQEGNTVAGPTTVSAGPNPLCIVEFFNGYLYCGDETDGGALVSPTGLYKVDPNTLSVLSTFTQVPYPTVGYGFIRGANGLIYAGDGHGILWQLHPSDLTYTGTSGSGEDGFLYDGAHVWSNIGTTAYYQDPSTLATIASGAPPDGGVPINYFQIGTDVYVGTNLSFSSNGTFYKLSISGSTINFAQVATYPTNTGANKSGAIKVDVLHYMGLNSGASDTPNIKRLRAYDSSLNPVAEYTMAYDGTTGGISEAQYDAVMVTGRIYLLSNNTLGYVGVGPGLPARVIEQSAEAFIRETLYL